MSDELNNEEAEQETSALEIPAEQEVAFDNPQAFIPATLEQLELEAHLDTLRTVLEEGIGGGTKPTDLADSGVVFDIVDAYLTSMVDDRTGEEQTKVVFRVIEQGTNIEHKVMQSSDARGIRRKYAEYFALSHAANRPTPPLNGFQFVYGDKVIAGNKAVILQRVPNMMKAVN